MSYPVCYRHGCECGESVCKYSRHDPQVQRAVSAYLDRDWARFCAEKRFLTPEQKRECDIEIARQAAANEGRFR